MLPSSPGSTPTERQAASPARLRGRASYQSLRAAVDSSPATVKRRIEQLLRLGLLRFRCDFARSLGGWPVGVNFHADVPSDHLPEVGYAMLRMPQIRSCAAVTGPHNLIMQASLHSESDIVGFESQIAAAHRGLVVARRDITLRNDKLLGHVLDPLGRSIDVIVPDVWAEPTIRASARRRHIRIFREMVDCRFALLRSWGTWGTWGTRIST